jgi:hypothetical protein
MADNSRNELRELVDSPNETLAVEYKGWLDFGSAEARADTARHIAALANYGGGNIVFGVNDDMEFTGPNPFPKVVYDRDMIAGIVKKYLQPPFQCDVRIVKSAAGNEHPVVIVPPHGATPICAKADGPMRKGILQGVYYTRKPGPESAAILTAGEWAPIIRRCAMHERAAILGAIDAALRGAHKGPDALADALRLWHDAAHAAFLKAVEKENTRPLLAKSHYHLTYAIQRSDDQYADANRLLEILHQVNSEVNDLVHTGLSMFYIYTKPGLAPSFETDAASGQGEHDFLECRLLRESDAEMWRVAADGKATLMREYWEDGTDFSGMRRAKPGALFSPNTMAESLAEFIRHARGFAERFDLPTTVSFRCEWHGLAGRIAYDPNARWMSGLPAHADHRVASGTWPVSALAETWPEIVAELGGPVARLFGLETAFTPQWVLGEAPKWRR